MNLEVKRLSVVNHWELIVDGISVGVVSYVTGSPSAHPKSKATMLRISGTITEKVYRAARRAIRDEIFGEEYRALSYAIMGFHSSENQKVSSCRNSSSSPET